ncbi:SRPBCC family protein [Roseobacter sp. YSTF-M11]|uniref:SRPBCC family protein n=1 Tax=Roseobacter insulae TaxID=2859783 RepID=A0A9X1FY79_9RHOB|nr:SRPBCC family protein [Roseobacter insulae]MBW4709517.1 SRPBCC family protein [Roseobacter insulae]
MTIIAKVSATAISLLSATTAWAADYKVKRSLELQSSPTRAWHTIGDFCDIDDWHPKVSGCSLKVMDGSLVRVLTLEGGDEVTQKRIAQEAGLSYTYKTVRSSSPVENHTATLSVEPLGKPLIEWSANFSSDDPAMEQVIVDEIEAGLAAIDLLLAASGSR